MPGVPLRHRPEKRIATYSWCRLNNQARGALNGASYYLPMFQNGQLNSGGGPDDGLGKAYTKQKPTQKTRRYLRAGIYMPAWLVRSSRRLCEARLWNEPVEAWRRKKRIGATRHMHGKKVHSKQGVNTNYLRLLPSPLMMVAPKLVGVFGKVQ